MIYVKYLILIVGLFAAASAIFNQEIAPAIVSVGAFISFAIVEVRDLKTLNDDKDDV